ncbi:MAG: acyl-CoA thioesterase [Myxococcales bacterium]
MNDRSRSKTPRNASCLMTQVVLPGDGNALGTAFGGRIMQWIDIAAAVACQRHSRTRVVTASMDDLHFVAPIRVGMMVELRAQVNAAFRTSMEAGVRVESEDMVTGERIHACTAYLTFVAQDKHGLPASVPALLLETDDDRRRHAAAVRRRASRLERARIKRERLAAEHQGKAR